MKFENIPQNPNQDAMAKIMAIQNQVMAMGANDYEKDAFDVIIKKLSTGGYLDVAKAVEDAKRIMDSKQDYH